MTIINLPRSAGPTTLAEAAALAEAPGGKEWKAYHAGIVLGFLAADLPDHFADQRTSAEQAWLAQPAPYEQALTLLRAIPGDLVRQDRLMRACGVLWGFKEATEDRADAATCANCDRRILSDSDDDIHPCVDHGWVHSDPCRIDLCRYCPTEPSFDKEGYYAAKYGDIA